MLKSTDRIQTSHAGSLPRTPELIAANEARERGETGEGFEQLLTGDLESEKVVIFCQFTNTVAALSARLARRGIKHVKIWGRDTRPTSRATAQNQFWDDPGTRVLIGTTAIEQSLNLQVSRFLINIDQIINPARMQQLAGRIRRDGSRYQSVYVVNLFARGTQEEAYLDILRREQALADPEGVIKIELAERGDDAGLLGASLLAREKFLAPPAAS